MKETLWQKCTSIRRTVSSGERYLIFKWKIITPRYEWVLMAALFSGTIQSQHRGRVSEAERPPVPGTSLTPITHLCQPQPWSPIQWDQAPGARSTNSERNRRQPLSSFSLLFNYVLIKAATRSFSMCGSLCFSVIRWSARKGQSGRDRGREKMEKKKKQCLFTLVALSAEVISEIM